jgi:hypothetical protein
LDPDLSKSPIDRTRLTAWGWCVDNLASSGGTCLRILLADDNERFRQRLRQLLLDFSEFELVGEAGDGEETLRLAGELCSPTL